MLTDDRLRQELAAAFREQADPVARMAVGPAGLFRQAMRARRKRAAARVASVTAVVAALATAVSLVTISARRTARPVTAAGPPGLLLDAAVTVAPSAPAAARGMPPYLVIADHTRPVADIRGAATGRVLSEVPLPGTIDPKMTQIAAAGDDRTFVLAVFSVSHGIRFYRLHIGTDGRSARLTRLAIPSLPERDVADGIAVTADGKRLAVAVQIRGEQAR